MAPLPDWPRAWGPPSLAGSIRSIPEDFSVDEVLDIDFAGEGEHDWLRIRKTGANTTWVADRLAAHANMPARDVGYAGLKDRHAVTTQWFSVRRKIAEPADWDRFAAEGVELLERHIHHRKLRRGAHRGNRFSIVARAPGLAGHADALDARLRQIAAAGVPNYFGEQRFGRDGGNVQLGRDVLAGRRLSRTRRSLGISALRSFEFNEGLAQRVDDGTWNRLRAGDVAALEGSGSIFDVPEVTAELEARCAELDLHPAGMLPALAELRVQAAHRALRLVVHEFDWQLETDRLRLDFRLGPGAFATAVLREIIAYPSA